MKLTVDNYKVLLFTENDITGNRIKIGMIHPKDRKDMMADIEGRPVPYNQEFEYVLKKIGKFRKQIKEAADNVILVVEDIESELDNKDYDIDDIFDIRPFFMKIINSRCRAGFLFTRKDNHLIMVFTEDEKIMYAGVADKTESGDFDIEDFISEALIDKKYAAEMKGIVRREHDLASSMANLFVRIGIIAEHARFWGTSLNPGKTLRYYSNAISNDTKYNLTIY